MGPTSITRVLIEKRAVADTHTEEGHEGMRRRLESLSYKPGNAKDRGQHQKLGARRREESPPEPLERNSIVNVLALDFWAPEL